MKRMLVVVGVILWMATLAAQKKPLPAWETDEEKAASQGKKTPFYLQMRTPPTATPYGPAEYARMEGVIIQVQTYNTAIRKYYAEMIKGIIAAKAIPYIIVENTSEQNTVTSQVLTPNGISASDVQFLLFPYDANWTRDYGPWHIYLDKSTRAIVDHHYYDQRPNDDAIPVKLGQLWGEQVFSSGFYTEGGNFMTDGLGTCWMSTGVFSKNDLADNEQNRATVAQLFKEYIGCDSVIFPVSIPGEGTTHIDMYSKILNQDTIIVSYSKSEWGAESDEIAQLDAAADLYANTPKPGGGFFKVVRIPMTFEHGWFSATYYTHTNSLIVNDHVLVPIYGRGTDEEALQVYQDLMPGYTIVGIDSNEIIPAGGSIHCTTMQVPVKQYKACGDGVIGEGEECEPLYWGGVTDCTDLGYESGDLFCTEECRFDVSACVAIETCGNGTIDMGEVCDGNTIACAEIADKDYVSGTATCLPSCAGWDEEGCVTATTDEASQPDDAQPDDAQPDGISPDDTTPDEVATDDTFPDGEIPDEATTDNIVVPDETTSDVPVVSDDDTLVLPDADTGKRAVHSGCGCSIVL